LHEELGGAVERYEALKAREGALDFLDLLLRTRNLLVADRQVRDAFQRRFRRIFVDEFQDTDPLQADILLLLAADSPEVTARAAVRPVPGKLFVVGDPKQSIYRFRRADVDLYLEVVDQLERCGAVRVELQASFRGVPGIQHAVNRAFAGVLDRPAGAGVRVAPYVPLAPVRDAIASQPAVVALPVPKPYAFRGVSARAIEASLPDATAAWIAWLVRESGWVVTERGGGPPVPVSARHVCLIFRRFVSFGEDVTRPYVDALEARGLPHLLVGGRAFHGREEIETLRAALAAIEWPDDQLSVFATLRGSLFAIGDEELFEYRHHAGTFHPFRVPEALPAHLSPVADACRVLRVLHQQRNRRPVADTVTGVLDAVRAHAGFVLRPGGEQVLANVLHVAELARQYEMEGGMSFRGFVERLHDEATRAQSAEAPVLEEGTDGVRLMTAHKAKGLEFPVVVLADITARLAPAEAGRTVDQARRLCAQRLAGLSPVELLEAQLAEGEQERREGERIAYVAATRARDVLVVPAVGDEPFDGWVTPLNDALYPEAGARRDGRPSPGVPAFASRDTVLERPDGDPARPGTVAPGLHTITGGGADSQVVWWSPEPGALDLGVRPAFGIRRDDLIVRDVAPEVLAAQHEAHARWQQGRAAAIASASAPSLAIVTATEAADDPGLTVGLAVDVEVDRVPGPRHASGPGFGALVHALLADVDLPAGVGVSGLADVHGRLLGASEDDRQAAVATVRAALAHAVVRRAAAALDRGACWREAPLTVRDGSGVLIEGAADLVFEEDGVLTVVDFKTGTPDPVTLARYRRQVQIYAAAVAGAMGRAARGVLLLV
ncbi:MAG: UvrD-helicase domain-containing protein, partial [Vicinamibacterales bacterium]